MNLSTAVGDYLAERAASGEVSPGAIRAMRSTLNRFVAHVGERPARSLKTKHVQDFLGRKPAARVTTRTELSVVRTFCRWCHAREIMPTEPTGPIHLPHVKRRLRQPAPPPPELDGSALAAFRRDQQRRHLSPRTIYGRQKALQSLALFVHPRTLPEATTDDIESWLDSCGLGSGGRYVYLSTVRSFFDYLERVGQVEGNPARAIPSPKVPRLLPRPIEDADLRHAMQGADKRTKCFLALAAYQGLRCQEIAGLRREDLLLDREPQMLVVSAAKGGSEGIVPLNPIVRRLLSAYGLPERGFVFRMNDGRPLKAGTVSTYINRYLRDVGVKATAHQLRHWTGTTLYQATKDLRLVQEVLRHRDPKSTAIYAGYSASGAATAVQALDVEAVPAAG